MKQLIYVISLCAVVSLSSCLETTTKSNTQNKNTNNSTTTTTTTTTTDDSGNTTTTTTTTTTTDTKNSFHSASGKFSINFLNIPQGPTMTEETNLAGMVQIFRYVDAISDNSMYIALYKDYPKGVITSSNTDDKLKLEANAFMKSFGGVSKTVEERLNGNKGISFEGALNDSIKLNMRSFFVGKRYYQFGTISTNNEITEKDSKKFITSFELD